LPLAAKNGETLAVGGWFTQEFMLALLIWNWDFSKRNAGHHGYSFVVIARECGNQIYLFGSQPPWGLGWVYSAGQAVFHQPLPPVEIASLRSQWPYPLYCDSN